MPRLVSLAIQHKIVQNNVKQWWNANGKWPKRRQLYSQFWILPTWLAIKAFAKKQWMNYVKNRRIEMDISKWEEICTGGLQKLVLNHWFSIVKLIIKHEKDVLEAKKYTTNRGHWEDHWANGYNCPSRQKDHTKWSCKDPSWHFCQSEPLYDNFTSITSHCQKLCR